MEEQLLRLVNQAKLAPHQDGKVLELMQVFFCQYPIVMKYST
jgi:hypothetical protein